MAYLASPVLNRPMRLDEIISAETTAVKKQLRQRRGPKLTPGPGRPDLSDFPSGDDGGGMMALSLSLAGPTSSSPLPSLSRTVGSPSSALRGSPLPKSKSWGGLQGALLSASPGSRSLGGGRRSPSVVSAGDVEELVEQAAELRATIQDMSTALNALKHSRFRKGGEVELLDNTLNNLNLEDDVTENMQEGMRKLDLQRGELNQAQNMVQKMLDYRERLTHMGVRLKGDRMTFELTLKAYEEALAVRRTEATDMKMLATEVRLEKVREERELARLRKIVQGEMAKWEEELGERRVTARRLEEARDEARAVVVTESLPSAAAVRGTLKRRASSRRVVSPKLQAEQDRTRRRHAMLQAALSQLCARCAVGRPDEIAAHYQRQVSEIDGFRVKRAQLGEGLNDLRERRAGLDIKLRDLKFFGGAEDGFNRAALDELTHKCDEARRQLRGSQVSRDRVEHLLMSIKQSVIAVSRKLEHVKRLPTAPGAIDRQRSTKSPAGGSGGRGASSSFGADVDADEDSVVLSELGLDPSSMHDNTDTELFGHLGVVASKMDYLQALMAEPEAGQRRNRGALDESRGTRAAHRVKHAILVANKMNLRIGPTAGGGMPRVDSVAQLLLGSSLSGTRGPARPDTTLDESTAPAGDLEFG